MSLTEQKSQHNNDQSPDVKNPARFFWLAVLILLVVGGAMYYIDINTNDLRSGKARPNTAEGLASRIQPVAQFALNVVEADQPLKTGKEVYDATCVTCHAAAVAGAPKFADKASWAPYIATGYEAMLHVALTGKGAMPAKGGNPSLSDLEVARAVVYMANEAGAGFAEPKDDSADGAADTAAAPAAAAPAAAAPAAAGGAIAAATPEQLEVGKKIYDSACVVCHSAGIAGAPKFGDKAAWAPYIDTGLDAMLQVAINGKGAMPPRGTAMTASDDDLRAAILYMVEQVR